MPSDSETNISLGFAFIEFQTPEVIIEAAVVLPARGSALH